MTRRIVITSGKGGVGKTTIVSGLGMALAGKGYKVLLVDMDFGLNNLDVVMGIENKIVYDIIDVLEGKCLPRQAVVQDFFENNLYIFPSSHSFCKVKFGAKELSAIISEIENLFDFVLIDCPAGIDGGFKRAVECANEHIVITTPHLSAVRDADKVVNVILSHLQVRPYVIINRARGDLILDGDMLSIGTIKDYLTGELIGVIPEDDEVSIQMYKGGRFNSNSDTHQSLMLIANNLINGENNIFDCTKKYKGFLGGIRKKIKRKV
ncbi:MAG: septum site-determining protein MinD [Christensenellales bacterium]